MKLKLLSVLALLGLGNVAFAENRALLVGLAEYKDPKANLRGPETDIKLMQEVIGKLGFKPSQIRVIQNQQATKANIVQQMKTWLTEGVGPNDKVVFYYTGHGAQVLDRSGDETDGCDESIVPYDMVPLVDDDIQLHLQNIKAREILVMFDSCFSGTATKSLFAPEGEVDADSKFWDKASTGCGMASNKDFSLDQGVANDKASAPNYIEFSAAAENEVALGALRPGEGSAFTQAVYNGLKTLPTPISFEALRDFAADWIRSRAKNRAHTPQLTGPTKWLNADFYSFGTVAASATVPPQVPYQGSIQQAGNSMELFDRLVRKTQFLVEARPSQPSYKLGDAISLQVRSSKGGYLNIIELDATGNMVVVFPNKFNSDNRVRANEIIDLPSTRYGNFKFTAVEPVGRSKVLALVTSEPLNLLNENMGSLAGLFRTMTADDAPALTTAVTRAIGVSSDAPLTPTIPSTPSNNKPGTGFGAAQLVLETVR